ncbi:methylenetetrahydrofolate reductase C-terminal domain-containing protein [Ilumatobacter sp.]|uniref:methylenetetrahydrofolate reductase C-terminal domain-containing protein n=1 Tax=Ilumatobacter sp. TaxID=1967498 RepID=UPI003B51E67D
MSCSAVASAPGVHFDPFPSGDENGLRAMGSGDPACPKEMVHGPCGGVRDDGGCEVEGIACPFADATSPVAWAGPDARTESSITPPARWLLDVRIDDTLPRLEPWADRLRALDAVVLIGEHLDEPISIAPAVAARRCADIGLGALVTVTGRDRTAQQATHEVGAVVEAGAVGVHCVTGDHPRARFPDRPGSVRFGSDGVRIAALAASAGAGLVSVAESPAATPTAIRPGRLLEKERAGATMGVLNHAGGVVDLEAFAREVRRGGAQLPLAAPVPVITSRRAAEALMAFPGLVLPDGFAAAIVASDQPVTDGVEAAVTFAADLLGGHAYRSINLSGGASLPSVERIEVLVRIIESVEERVGPTAAPSPRQPAG